MKHNGDEESIDQPLKQQKLFQQQNENVQVTWACIKLNNPNCTMYESNTILYKHATKARLNSLA